MQGNWRALFYLVLAFEIPLLTVLGYFVGSQIDAMLGIADTHVVAGVGIVAGLYLCWVTFSRLRQFVEKTEDPGEE
ncbi:MAG TPA: hypothetical protein P5077_07395 [bacterium]|nr:hypothetical protein [bacterium]